MNPSDHLHAAITQRTTDLFATVPSDRTAATLALARAIDCLPPPDLAAPVDAVTGVSVSGLGASRALQLVLEAPPIRMTISPDLDAWGTTFLEACRHLAAAELVLAHIETGFMRLQIAPDGSIDVRFAQRATPLRWRERLDAVWWASWLTAKHPDTAPVALVDRLAMQHDLPATEIAGVDLDLAKRVIGQLIEWTLGQDSSPQARLAQGQPLRDQELVAQFADALDVSPSATAAVVEALTLGPDNAAWHAAVPGIADPPLIRLDRDQVVVSRRALVTDPFRFLSRELRRRNAEAWNTAAVGREVAFRSDLYALFSHRRFVTSSGRIELRWEKGSIRTDIDAAIFDRKSGTLALFELKSHEPFARSSAELIRTQENVRFAGRQIAGVLDWINRHGADEILNRIDRRTAKGYRVQKVQAFVLGRHLVDGEDKRAIWATWPQVLRVLGDSAVEELGGNPIVSLANRLARVAPPVSPQMVTGMTTLDLGETELRIHPLR